MPPADSADVEQQKRNNIREILVRSGISIGEDRLASLSRAVDAARTAGDAIAQVVAGERPPPVFRAPEPRDA